MFIKQLYTGCLSEAAYFIASNGEAAVVDPLRDIESYLQLATEHQVAIRYIFETHFHADFVSGHLELAKATGATIVYGPQTQTAYPVHVAADGERFRIGALEVEVLHTPGHTLESSCYLLYDEARKPYAVFTGDTLFVGDVGRPDLAQEEGRHSREDLASLMYQSIQQKLMPLPDETLIYPAHGPGSACGKSLGPETWSTMGQQKQTNYALQAGSEAAFVKAVTEGLTAPPSYFPINVALNKKGYTSMDDIMNAGLKALPVNDFKEKMQDALVIDTRAASAFTSGFIPESVFIGLEGRFAEWAGSLLPFNQPLLLVTDQGKEKEALTRLARVGFDKVVGYLEGGFEAWQQSGEAVDMIIDVEADELAMDLPFDNNLVVVDVRKPGEYSEGHVKHAVNLPLNEMNDMALVSDFEEEQNLYIHCAGGYRSVIAASLLKRQGIHNLRNVLGGWKAINEESKIPKEKDTAALN